MLSVVSGKYFRTLVAAYGAMGECQEVGCEGVMLWAGGLSSTQMGCCLLCNKLPSFLCKHWFCGLMYQLMCVTWLPTRVLWLSRVLCCSC